jgi:F0F1-type ATP synthase membrane subunit b/b'
LTAAKDQAGKMIAEARLQLDAELAAAKQNLAAEAERLADAVTASVLQGSRN